MPVRTNMAFAKALQRSRLFMLATTLDTPFSHHEFKCTFELASSVCRRRIGSKALRLPHEMETMWMSYLSLGDLNNLRRTSSSWRNVFVGQKHEAQLSVAHVGYVTKQYRAAMFRLRYFRHGSSQPWSFVRLTTSGLDDEQYNRGRIVGLIGVGETTVQAVTSRGYVVTMCPHVAHETCYHLHTSGVERQMQVVQVSKAPLSSTYALLVNDVGIGRIFISHCIEAGQFAMHEVTPSLFPFLFVRMLRVYSENVVYFTCKDGNMYVALRNQEGEWSLRMLALGGEGKKGNHLQCTPSGCVFSHGLKLYHTTSPDDNEVQEIRIPGPGRVVSISAPAADGTTRVVVAVRDELRAVYSAKLDRPSPTWQRLSMCLKSQLSSMDKIQFVANLMLFMQGTAMHSISLLDSYPIPKPITCPSHWGDKAVFHSMCNNVLAVGPGGRGLYSLMHSCGGRSALSLYC
tara:strand:- start:301 stop:1674 length:1374 start_codon:yes stop_codon:yes gene_type:complete